MTRQEELEVCKSLKLNEVRQGIRCICSSLKVSCGDCIFKGATLDDCDAADCTGVIYIRESEYQRRKEFFFNQ